MTPSSPRWSATARTYQQDPANGREALREVALDVAEGADMVMVKPALGYLDVVAAVAAGRRPGGGLPGVGEYAMIEAAAARGWIDRERTVLETLTSIRRAGASILLTYWAAEVAEWLRQMTTTTAATDVRWLAPEEQSVWRAFLDVSRLMSDQMNRQLSDESGMSLPEYEILVALSEAPDRRLRMSELADRVLSSRSRITHTVGRMEERGHVHREACADDGRGVLLRADRRRVRRARGRGSRPRRERAPRDVRPAVRERGRSARRGVAEGPRGLRPGVMRATSPRSTVGSGPIARCTAGLATLAP